MLVAWGSFVIPMSARIVACIGTVSSAFVESLPPSPAQPLRDALRARRVQARIADAEFIRDYPDSPERREEAERHVRDAMYECTLGHITDDERARILHILAFAVPPLPDFLAKSEQAPWSADTP